MSDDPAFVSDPPPARAAQINSQASVSSPSQPSVPGHLTSPVFREIRKPQKHVGDLRDVELSVTVELGRVRMRLEELLKLSKGAVLELDQRAGDPVEVRVNDQLVARGEVVIVDGKQLAVRIREIVARLDEGKV